MRKVTLDEDDGQNRLITYYKAGTICVSSGRLIFLKDEARDKINSFIMDVANEENNRHATG